MDADPKTYLAFLLRLWQVNQNGEHVWHASLEDPHTGERRGFSSLEKLLGFLRCQTEEASEADSKKCQSG